MTRIITIGREFGSGGRELGKKLAERLGFAYYDNEIISEIAKKTELAKEYVEGIVEKHTIPMFHVTVGRTLFVPYDYIANQNASVFNEQANVIKEMAEKSDCVIVGRCADYILREKEPFRIFVYSDIETKMARCRERGHDGEDLSDRQLQRQIKAVDRARADYYEFYTGLKWGDMLNYDICVNTTNTDIAIIVNAVAKMFERTEQSERFCKDR